MNTSTKNKQFRNTAKPRLTLQQRMRRTILLLVVVAAMAAGGGFTAKAWQNAAETTVQKPSLPDTSLPIINWPFDQIEAAVAFSDHAGNYLVVWQHQPDENDDNWIIYGRLVDTEGLVVANPFDIAGSGARPNIKPDLAYHPDTTEYLVVWEYGFTTNDHDIYAHRVTGTGAVIGNPFVVSAEQNSEGSPAVTANPKTGEYLVVWEEKLDFGQTSQSVISGQRLSDTGGALGDPIAIGLGLDDQLAPAVASEEEGGRYLVVWQEASAQNGFDIIGQMVKGDGSLLGDPIAISSGQGDQKLPRVAYNSIANQFMVVWQDHGGVAENSWVIRGQRLSSSGALLGASLNISTVNTDVRENPDIAYKASADQYLVVWEYEFLPDDHDIMQRRVKADGSFASDEEPGSVTESFEAQPAVASDNAKGFFVAWEDNRNSETMGIDIYGTVIDIATPNHVWLPLLLR